MDRDDGVLAFDVNESMVDLRPLDALFADLLGDGRRGPIADQILAA